jgi:hypothetical protein
LFIFTDEVIHLPKHLCIYININSYTMHFLIFLMIYGFTRVLVPCNGVNKPTIDSILVLLCHEGPSWS